MDFRMAVGKGESASAGMIGSRPIPPLSVGDGRARVYIEHWFINAVRMLVHEYPGHGWGRLEERAHLSDFMAPAIVLPARAHGRVHREAAGAGSPAQRALGGARIYVGRAFVNVELPPGIRAQKRVLIIR